jgi:gluconokinase
MRHKLTLLIMGVAGSGKTIVGKQVARKLAFEFLDGDDFQPSENVEKIRGGRALSDADRYAWFSRLKSGILERSRRGDSLVIACSALKREYRAFLLSGFGKTDIIYLKIDPKTAVARLSGRENHFFPASLSATQFEILEAPRAAITIDARQPVDWVVGQIVLQVQRRFPKDDLNDQQLEARD